MGCNIINLASEPAHVIISLYVSYSQQPHLNAGYEMNTSVSQCHDGNNVYAKRSKWQALSNVIYAKTEDLLRIQLKKKVTPRRSKIKLAFKRKFFETR